MQKMSRVLRSCLVYATVLVFIQTSGSRVSAEGKELPQKVVTLKQEMFTLSTQHGPPRLEHLRFESADSVTTSVDQLPPKAKEGVLRLGARVIPQLEFTAVDPREAIRFIVRKPKPKSAIRLGLVAEDKEREADPSWLGDLSFGEQRLSCVATNVSFLDFSVVLADAFDCEFGVTADGEPLFSTKTAEAKAKHRIYAIKSK